MVSESPKSQSFIEIPTKSARDRKPSSADVRGLNSDVNRSVSRTQMERDLSPSRERGKSGIKKSGLIDLPRVEVFRRNLQF